MSNRVPLPAGTVLGKSYEYGLDVNLGTYAEPVWQPFRRISGYQPSYPGTTTDVSSYDDLGSPNEDITGRGFATSFTALCNRSLSTGLYLPEMEKVMAAAKAKGEGAVLDVRFYHKPEIGTPNPNDAGRAFVTVEITRSNTDNQGIETKSIALTGKGEYTPIPNPFAGWDVTAPVISGVTPEGEVTGGLITIVGAGLLGATSVTFDTIPATDYEVIDNATIIAVLPSDTAGPVPVVVTTAGGVSPSFTFNRGA